MSYRFDFRYYFWSNHKFSHCGMSNLVCSALSLDLIVFCLFNSIKFLSRPLDASPSQGDTVNTTTRKNYSGDGQGERNRHYQWATLPNLLCHSPYLLRSSPLSSAGYPRRGCRHVLFLLAPLPSCLFCGLHKLFCWAYKKASFWAL